MDKSETLKLLTLIASSFDNFLPKNHETQKMFVEIWHESLEEIPFEAAKLALKEHMKESVYTPKVADIYQRYMRKQMPDFPDPVEQFNTVIRAIGKYGYNKSEEAMQSFHPYTRKVVEMNGGFRKFCMAEVDNEMSDRKHFVETYTRLIERETRTIKDGGNSLLQLVGEKKESTLLDSLVTDLITKINQ
jgi:hypothetical protein